jgi:hypothetical protein
MRTIVDSYRGGVAVTPSDSTVLAPTRGLYIGGTGNVIVDFADGTTGVLLTAPALGVILPISVVKVKATGTTATAILAIY